jgi:hypothetical protein
MEEWSSSEGRSPEGGGRTAVTLGRSPARRRGSGGRKTSEVDAWAMRDECAALGRGRMRRTVRGGENFQRVGGSSVLRGAAGRGAQRGGRRVEAKQERGREGGPGHSGVASAWQSGEAVGAALTSGAGNTLRLIRFSNRIKFISNGFKFVSNFDR